MREMHSDMRHAQGAPVTDQMGRRKKELSDIMKELLDLWD